MIWVTIDMKIAPDKILHDTAFEIANTLQYDGYQREHASMV